MQSANQSKKKRRHFVVAAVTATNDQNQKVGCQPFNF